ncbi:hypothetical protein MFFC18_28260 [Mariniblastus fucicola]|uniref:Uncharacterized protein n=1 Tax=Mariniblastus fucicola TaxID=980251 RepID=A0A5B9P9F5_9BACT|nr:hypothetical protein MFFC18_28260 [Mariniblastus fucicola]
MRGLCAQIPQRHRRPESAALGGVVRNRDSELSLADSKAPSSLTPGGGVHAIFNLAIPDSCKAAYTVPLESFCNVAKQKSAMPDGSSRHCLRLMTNAS